MGVYDTFRAPCPACGEETEVQCKDFDCVLKVYDQGDPIQIDRKGECYLLESGEECSCKRMLTINFQKMIDDPNGVWRFVGFVTGKQPDDIALPFSSFKFRR